VILAVEDHHAPRESMYVRQETAFARKRIIEEASERFVEAVLWLGPCQVPFNQTVVLIN
jgi:hypothetical protein